MSAGPAAKRKVGAAAARPRLHLQSDEPDLGLAEGRSRWAMSGLSGVGLE